MNTLLLSAKSSAGETGNRPRAELHEASLYPGFMRVNMVNTGSSAHRRALALLCVPGHPSSFSTLRGESTHANASAPSSQSTESEWAPDELSGLLLPVPGRAERSPQSSAADAKGSSSWRPGDLCRQHSKRKAETDTDGWTGTPSWQGLGWRRLRHLFLRFSSLAPWSPSLEHVRRTLPGH